MFNAGGDDEITVATANLESVTADSGAGDDILTGTVRLRPGGPLRYVACCDSAARAA